MKKSISTFFNMPKNERNGVLVLMFLVGVFLVFRFFIPHLFKPDYSKHAAEFQSLLAMLDEETDTLPNQAKFPDFESLSKSKPRTRAKNGVGFTSPAPIAAGPAGERIFHDFDPNKAGYNELTGLGFSSRAANALLRYREKGGKFREPSDMLILYGIDTLFFSKIRPFIRIQGEEHSSVVCIEINSADTSAWMRLKGIGPVYANRICKYRELLGGFFSVEQLKEVYNLPEELYAGISRFVTIDTAMIRKIDLNFAGEFELAKHPYSNRDIARKIVQHRTLNGSFQTLSALLTDSLIDTVTFSKLSPYLKLE